MDTAIKIGEASIKIKAIYSVEPFVEYIKGTKHDYGYGVIINGIKQRIKVANHPTCLAQCDERKAMLEAIKASDAILDLIEIDKKQVIDLNYNI